MILYTSGDTDVCAPGCVLPPACGDGKVDGGEACDDGAGNVSADQAGRCRYDCQPAFILL